MLATTTAYPEACGEPVDGAQRDNADIPRGVTGRRFMKMTGGRLLVAGAAIAAMMATVGSGLVDATPPVGAAATQQVEFATANLSPAQHIQHVVVIYQENQSFDGTLGKFCQAHVGRCDGYTGPVRLSDGTVVNMAQSPDVVPDVWHDVPAQTLAVNGGAMDGWAGVSGCRPFERYECLTYYTGNQVPNLAALASKYVVSDHTFSMYNSPSWGAHVYAAAATLDNFTGENPWPVSGVATGPGWGCDSNRVAPWVNPATKQSSLQPSCIPARPGFLNSTQYPYNGAFRPTTAQWVPTIMNRLEAQQRTWKLYSSYSVWSICPSFAECQFGPQHFNVVPTADFLTDAAAGRMPSYSVLLPDGPGGGTSQHNGASMRVGDNWIGQAVAALQKSPNWSSTAIFITYDDCGCFYDHVTPGLNPDGTRQGIRVPMVIVSPYAKVAYTDRHPATYASILKFTEEAFGLPPLSVNDRDAYDFANSFDFSAPVAGPRVSMSQNSVSAASRQYAAEHPLDLEDPDPDDQS